MAQDPPSINTPDDDPVWKRVERFGVRVPPGARTYGMSNLVSALLNKAVDTDRATQLPNIDYVKNELMRVITDRQKRKIEGAPLEPYTVIFLDLNKFSTYNQELGHIPTDRLVQAFAGALSESIRLHPPKGAAQNQRSDASNPPDIIARPYPGGDEFIILMQGINKDQAKGRMKGILKSISEKTFLVPVPDKNKKVENLTFSYGCYQLGSKEISETPDSVLHEAEQSMRRRKDRMRKDSEKYTPCISRINPVQMAALVGKEDTVIVAPAEIARAAQN